MTATQGEKVGVAWSWPDDQCISYRITPKPGSLMSATGIAKQLLAISKMMEAPEDGLRWKVMLRAIFTEADGSIRFDLAVAPKQSALKSRPEPAAK